MIQRVLILGGTTEGRELATALATDGRFEVEVSLAGRTQAIRDQGAPMRVGGFGGVDGLTKYLRERRVDVLIDATHPFAAIMSEHAIEAARAAQTRVAALRRPAWTSAPADRWIDAPDLGAAVAEVGQRAGRVFLALGRKEVHAFEAVRPAFYLVRSVDPIDPPLAVPFAEYVVARGPFSLESERKLLQTHRIDCIVCRNSGGEAAFAKLEAARELGIEVVMIRRPILPDALSLHSVEEALSWLAHVCSPSALGASVDPESAGSENGIVRGV